MISTAGLDPYVANASRLLVGTLRGLGYSATLTSGYRSPDKQAKLFSQYLAGRTKYPVAPPGTSTHEFGYGIDVASNAPDPVLRFAADVAGLVWFGPGDRVHFDPFGPALWREMVRG